MFLIRANSEVGSKLDLGDKKYSIIRDLINKRGIDDSFNTGIFNEASEFLNYLLRYPDGNFSL